MSQGHYRDEHLFALSQALRTWHYYNGLVLECDREIEKQLATMTRDREEVQAVNKRKAIRYHRPDIKDLH